MTPSRQGRSNFLLRDRMKLFENYPTKLDDVYPGQIEFDNPELSQAHRSHQVVPRLPSFSLSARMTAEPPRPQPTGVCAGFRSHREMNTTPRAETCASHPIIPPLAFRLPPFNDIPPPEPNKLITLAEHQAELQQVVSARGVELRETFQDKLRAQLMSMTGESSQLAAETKDHLEKTISSYTSRFNAILSWLKQTEEAKEAAAKLETEIAAVTAVNESMRMTHEANLAELADQYDILQIQLSERLTNEQKEAERKRSRPGFDGLNSEVVPHWPDHQEPEQERAQQSYRRRSSAATSQVSAPRRRESIRPAKSSRGTEGSIPAEAETRHERGSRPSNKPAAMSPGPSKARGPAKASMTMETMAALANAPSSINIRKRVSTMSSADGSRRDSTAMPGSKRESIAVAGPKLRDTLMPSSGSKRESIMAPSKRESLASTGAPEADLLHAKIRAKQQSVRALEGAVQAMQSEIDALPPEIARLSAENDKLAKDEIERLAQVEDENEKSAAQEIAAVKQRLVDSRDALAALIKKTTRQKQYNDKLRSKLSSVEMKCRMARDALERDRQSETARQQRLEAKFAEQRLALAGVFRRIMDSVESCRRVTDGLHTGLTCSVCFNEFDDPYVFSPCGHTSCQVCIPADRFCPVCAHEDGAPLTTTCMKNDLLARIIEQHKWFIEPMMEAGDAIRAVCTQVLSGKPPSTS